MTDLEDLFKLSPIESARLGSPVHRIQLPVGTEPSDIAALTDAAKKRGKLTIARCDVLNFRTWQALLSANVGLFDILEEFRGPTEALGDGSPIKSSPDIIALKDLDSEIFNECKELCGEVLQGIENHYSLDTRIPKDWIRGGYQDWFQRLAQSDANNSGVWVRLHGRTVAGFLAWRVSESESLEVALYGTRPSFRNRGIATELIRFAAQHSLKSPQPTRDVLLVTQTWNFPSKLTALRAGLLPFRTILTFHLWS
jgi:hypothetical protein